MEQVLTEKLKNAIKRSRYDRLMINKKVCEFNKTRSSHVSERQTLEALEIPRSTAKYWLSKQGKTGFSLKAEQFFASEEGQGFLHRILASAEFVMNQVGNCGIRLISLFLKLSKLDAFIASSYGSLQKRIVQMEQEIIQYEETEKTCLSKMMAPKQITIAQDETFHPKPCLVAIEPVSNFILLEKYSEDRTAASWSSAMAGSLENLPVEVIQSITDEAAGILRHVSESFDAHKSPDLFHILQDLTWAIAHPLKSKITKAEKDYAYWSQMLEILKLRKSNFLKGAKEIHPLPLIEKAICKAEQNEQKARKKLNKAKLQYNRAFEAKKAISYFYHPFDLQTGRPQTIQNLNASLQAKFNIIEKIALKAGLAPKALNLIKKSKRLLGKMLETISFFWETIKHKITVLELPKNLETKLHYNIIPYYYFKIISKKASNAELKKAYIYKAQVFKARFETLEWNNLDENKRNQLLLIAKECAQLFQRSSSCVEGRNGYLSFRHHGLHNISERKLKVLTTLHNYYIKRSDNTTAAERFYGIKPKDLFEQLLQKMPYPAKPWNKENLNILRFKNAA